VKEMGRRYKGWEEMEKERKGDIVAERERCLPVDVMETVD
jgi:hypothetical protein